MKIVNKKKFVRSVVIILGLIVLLILVSFNNSYSKTEIKYKEEFIISGDTLWSIAEYEINNNEYFSGKDIRDVIYQIKKVNCIENQNLEIGQKISIPVI